MKQLKVNLKDRAYTVTVGRNILNQAKTLFNLERNVVVLTDDGVPRKYAEIIASQCKSAQIITIAQGESSKNVDNYIAVLTKMMKANLTRADAVVGVGGGVVGDLAGFCASTYMRGVDFYNVPTTLLSMVDSSVGGKTGVDFCGVKNSIGTFYQPRGVLIDVETLNTLLERQFKSGLVESIKMAATFDKDLFDLIESGKVQDNAEEIIIRSLNVKKAVVEQDEKESGLRKVLNFGHTLAHAIEGVCGMHDYYHGEAVAIGMVKMSSGVAKERIVKVLKTCGLPTEFLGDKRKMAEFIRCDKKCSGDTIDVVKTDEIGTYRIERVSLENFINQIL